MKKVLINTDFRDRYTGKIHKAGKTEKMSESRVAEVKEVNPELITVIGDIQEENQGKDQTDGNNANNSDNGGSDDNKSADK